MPPASPLDELYMRRALRLARRGLGFVEPNPMVGCVIVRRGRILGEGWHRRFGGPHAEIEALRRCTSPPRGATAYVTLEPCCHHGKTPPCTEALIATGVRRVVAAMTDPNPRVNGRGLERLRAAGIEVEVGVASEDARALAAPFAKLVGSGRPWVILKWAQSLDGRLATRTGDTRWISDAAARLHAHRTRARMDAILVGVNTVLTDDPLLTCRGVRPRRVATRIVLDTRLRTPPRARLVRTAREAPTWIVCGRDAPSRREAALAAAGVRIHRLPASREGVRLASLLDWLGAQQMTNVLVEGGGRILGGFVDQRLADEVQVYVAPLLIGGEKAAPALGGRGTDTLAHAPQLVHPVCTESDTAARPPVPRRVGNCWLLTARLRSS